MPETTDTPDTTPITRLSPPWAEHAGKKIRALLGRDPDVSVDYDDATREIANLYPRHGETAAIRCTLTRAGAPYVPGSVAASVSTNGVWGDGWPAPATFASNVVTPIPAGTVADTVATVEGVTGTSLASFVASASASALTLEGGDLAATRDPSATADSARSAAEVPATAQSD